MSSAELSVFIRAIGVRTPERKLTNAELSKMVDTSDEWIQTRSGISERRIAGPGENPSDLGAQAAAQALQRAGLTPADVDLLIVAAAILKLCREKYHFIFAMVSVFGAL